ncbi:hypothetical protein LZ189_14870, partial [Rhodovulum sulfidophilum]|nr:hypothetical protein [Rhodovulum sulfidophilum]
LNQEVKANPRSTETSENCEASQICAKDGRKSKILSRDIKPAHKRMALVAAVGGAGFDMIVIDTMARVMGGGMRTWLPILPTWCAIST